MRSPKDWCARRNLKAAPRLSLTASHQILICLGGYSGGGSCDHGFFESCAGYLLCCWAPCMPHSVPNCRSRCTTAAWVTEAPLILKLLYPDGPPREQESKYISSQPATMPDEMTLGCSNSDVLLLVLSSRHFCCVFRAVMQRGQLDEAREVLEMLESNGSDSDKDKPKPRFRSYQPLIRGLVRRADIEGVMELWAHMQRHNVLPKVCVPLGRPMRSRFVSLHATVCFPPRHFIQTCVP